MRKFAQLMIAMIYQNIVIIIAIGVLRVLFGDYGWWYNESIIQIVNPAYHTLLPILIAHTGGKLLGGQKGAIIAAIATFCLTLSSNVPVILGAMILGPLAGWTIKKLDEIILEKLPGVGYELLIGNIFTALVALFFMLISYLLIGKLFSDGMELAINLLDSITYSSWLPFLAIVIEPFKVLFFNNLINFGILAPLGIQQANEVGKSIFFLLESNPGPGLGILLAYYLKVRGEQRKGAKMATSIHFLGGIHEVYFSYVLMNPKLIIALILGGFVGNFTFQSFNVGLVSISSPGSIFLVLGLAPREDIIYVLFGVILSALASFLLSILLIRKTSDSPTIQDTEDTMNEFYQIAKDHKGIKRKGRELNRQFTNIQETEDVSEVIFTDGKIHTVFFVCEAGIGSSAMGAAMLKKKLQQAGVHISVENTSINGIPNSADLIICHERLLTTIKEIVPNKSYFSLRSFTDMKAYDQLVKKLKDSHL